MTKIHRLISLLLATTTTAVLFASQIGLAAHYEGEAADLAAAAQARMLAASQAKPARRG